MIIDLKQPSSPTEFDCDIALIGAGAIGTLMAAEMSRKGKDVLLIEGGGASLETAEQELNEALSTGHTVTGLDNARYRLLGGSTNFWGGQIPRFSPMIFEPRPWLSFEGWPVGRAELDPYYDRCARLLGLPEDFTEEEVWGRVGSEAPDFGADLHLFLTRTLINRSTAHIFAADIEGKRLRTLIHAHSIGFGASEDGSHITHIALKSLSGRIASVRARQVVVACGTVEIARLLLHPFLDGRKTPWGDNPWLGRGFFDHIEAITATVELLDKAEFHRMLDNIFIDKIKYYPRIKLTDSAQRRLGSLDIAGRFEFRSHYAEHLKNLRIFVRSLLSGRRPDNIGQLPAYLAAVWKVAVPLVVRYLKSHRGFNPSDAGIDFAVMSEQRPIPVSAITLLDEADALGRRKIAVNWAIDGGELETIAAFTELAGAAFESKGLARFTINPLLSARDPAFMNEVLDFYHQMGGARIGASSQSGVVDSNLKVFGTDNLYVAGAAVFPVSGFANPTYTAMAMSIRLADHLMSATATTSPSVERAIDA